MNRHLEIQYLLPWYVNGTLDRSEQEKVRHHLAECEACQSLLHEYEELAVAVKSPSVPAPSYDVLAQSLKEIHEERATAKRTARAAWLSWNAGRHGQAWLAAAAMLMLALIGFQNLYEIPRLERQVAQARQPVPAANLVLKEIVRAGVQSLRLEPGQTLMLTLDHPEDFPRYARYRFELRGPNRVQTTAAMPAPVHQEPYVLDFKSGWSAGDYVLTLYGDTADPSKPVATYQFTIKE